jgi:hypothetical protein
MKNPWLVAIAILPSVGAADIADAMTYKDIAGQWCGDVTDYVFTPDALTVKFHDGRPANVFKITKYTYTNNSVRIDWPNDAGKESVTVFGEFIGNAPWRSSRTATNRADRSIAAETLRRLPVKREAEEDWVRPTG